MQTINYQRVAIGALLAIPVLLLGEFALIGSLGPTIMSFREAAHMPNSPPQPILAIIEVLTVCFMLSWLYAAMRPRFGPGIATALRSGMVVWICVGMIGTIHMINDNFGFPTWLLLAIAAGMLPVCLVASIAAAWKYRE